MFTAEAHDSHSFSVALNRSANVSVDCLHHTPNDYLAVVVVVEGVVEGVVRALNPGAERSPFHRGASVRRFEI